MKKKIQHECPSANSYQQWCDRYIQYTTIVWDADGDDKKINKVLMKFEEYCEPKKNVSYERYCTYFSQELKIE